MASREREERIHKQGFTRVAGVDEAGRGPLAGPVVAAAVILPTGIDFSQFTDSKKLTPTKRLELYNEIISNKEIDYGVGIVPHSVIDRINILQATYEAFSTSIAELKQSPDYILIDGNRAPKMAFPAEGIVKGDLKEQSIAAASILAKVTRDKLMKRYSKKWPEYGFDAHMGYPTKNHIEALKIYGPCPIHRLTFAPIKSWFD